MYTGTISVEKLILPKPASKSSTWWMTSRSGPNLSTLLFGLHGMPSKTNVGFAHLAVSVSAILSALWSVTGRPTRFT
jgi:hypothetical protein